MNNQTQRELLARASYIGSMDNTLYHPINWESEDIKDYILSLVSVPKELEEEFVQAYKKAWIANN